MLQGVMTQVPAVIFQGGVYQWRHFPLVPSKQHRIDYSNMMNPCSGLVHSFLHMGGEFPRYLKLDRTKNFSHNRRMTLVTKEKHIPYHPWDWYVYLH